MTDVLTLQSIHHTFEKGTINENHVLKGVNLSLKQGDFVTFIEWQRYHQKVSGCSLQRNQSCLSRS